MGALSAPSSSHGSSATILWLRVMRSPADGEAVDDRLAAGLAGPAGGDVEADLGLAGVLLDRFDDFAERVEVEAVDAALYGIQHSLSPLTCWWVGSGEDRGGFGDALGGARREASRASP